MALTDYSLARIHEMYLIWHSSAHVTRGFRRIIPLPVSRKGSDVSSLCLLHERVPTYHPSACCTKRVPKRHAYLTHNSCTASWVSQERPKMLTQHEYFIPEMHATPQTSLAALPAMLRRHDRQAYRARQLFTEQDQYLSEKEKEEGERKEDLPAS